MNASDILAAAGWKPAARWPDGYTFGTCVGGEAPDGTVYVKNWAMIRPGDPRHTEDTPDTAEEAALWLVEHAKQRAPAQLTTPATLDIPLAQIEEAGESLAHEGDGETGEEAAGDPLSDEYSGPDDRTAPTETVSVTACGDDIGDDHRFDGADKGGDTGVDVAPIDADFTTTAPDLGAEILEENGPQFVFGDNLDQMRTAAIGLVMRAALARMPAWTDTDTARLSELRNFAMGVSEGRWADDAGSRAWLEELEARLRLRSQIVSCRDTKVEFLNEASRSEVMAFDPESDWP